MKLELSVDGQIITIHEELHISLPPEKLEAGKFYKLEMMGYNLFPINRQMLLKCDGKPLASVDIVGVHNYLLGGRVHSEIEYYVRLAGKSGGNQR